jgi:hypothetical protein
MNEVTKPQNTSVAAQSNPFIAYGEAVAQKSIVGKLLKFSKGDYLAGQEEEEVPFGTQFVANMDELLVGWIRWEASKPTDQIMGKVKDNYQIPNRNELGDTDETQWETDAQGQPRDPWQLTNYWLMKGTGDDTELYTFTTSSKGGLGSIGDVTLKYGRAASMHPDEWPVVQIGASSYEHRNRSIGRIKFPTFKIVGWAPKSVFAEADADSEPEAKPVKKPRL